MRERNPYYVNKVFGKLEINKAFNSRIVGTIA